MSSGFKVDPDYVDVAERIREFKSLYPDGSLQPATPGSPYTVEEMPDGSVLIVYTAAAYRTPDDDRPGIGVASEPFPGRTPYTKGSEVQNAETSAWGRAIVALGIPTKRVASSNEVSNRRAEQETTAVVSPPIDAAAAKQLRAEMVRVGLTDEQVAKNLAHKADYRGPLDEMPVAVWEALMHGLSQMPTKTPPDDEPAAAVPVVEDPDSAPQEAPRAHADTSDDPDPAAEAEAQAGFDALGGKTATKTGTRRRAADPQMARLVLLWNEWIAAGLGSEEALRARLMEYAQVTSRRELTGTQRKVIIAALEGDLAEAKRGAA